MNPARFPTGTARASTRNSRPSSCPRSDPEFDLAGTLNSGQVFRWDKLKPQPGTGYTVPGTEIGFEGWIGRSCARVFQRDGILSYSGASAQAVRRYFSLDEDLPAILRGMDADPYIHAAIAAHRGLRIIRQEPWECLASFLLSANNNILRLTGILARLCKQFGETADGHGHFAGLEARFLFPSAEALARIPERELLACGTGYRAPFLRETARRVASGRADLERWRGLEDEALRRELMELPGVGEKVAECVMLFGYGRAEAFPVDVWISRVMRERYFHGRKVQDREIREFALRHFGPRCGWAQQYLFCRARIAERSGIVRSGL